MRVDPTDPETFDAEAGNGRSAGAADEVPEADAAEQRTEVGGGRDEPLTHIDPDTASEGDAADQARAVDLGDEEDYR
ncbi:hypothetical protein ACFXP3_32470 [Streptomyces sp. NPDC059096]|uniref:hypothetical protein n=1 Tax=unclassified Streptomyces TaxID=2593676 RepID=UPI0036B8B241